MKRFGIGVAGTIFFTTVLFIRLNPSAQAAPSVTGVCGAIAANTTWTAANSPYEVCAGGATVNAGITLTVQSGVTVQFVPGSSPKLTVQGKLLALGAPGQPITFTAVITAQAPGAWQGLTADGTPLNPAVVSLNHVTLDYGGTNAVFYGAQLYADHAVISVTHSLVRNGQKNGLWSTGNGSVNIEDTALLNNAADAVHLIQPRSGLALSGLSASGNGLNAIYVDGTTYLRGQQHWPAAGIPYIVNGVLGNLAGDALTVDPGSELQFTASGYLNIGGDFQALGQPGAPITFTGQTKAPGAWAGLVLFGGQQPANAQLERVTLEYGGRNANGANVTVDAGYLVAHNSVIRHSQRDGVRLNTHAQAALLNSQIISNTLYGVRNTQITHAILATNDWWGDPNGPTDDVASCSTGHGDKITAGVLFRPVLTSTNLSAVFPLSNDPSVSLTPRKWFGPADGLTRIYFDITVVDGNGLPLAGRTVRLNTTLGTATDGGVTDIDGHTLAFLVSTHTGDAEVSATVDVTGCEGALSPTSRVTFKPPVNILNLFPDSPASYFDGNITVSPQPVIYHVPALVSARLTNPLTVPITVDVTFAVVQSGINLTYGPFHEVVGQVIPPKSTVTLSADWVPPTTGHICVRVIYTVTGLGSGLSLPAGPSSGSADHNNQSIAGSTGSAYKANALVRTLNALDAMGGFMGNAFDTDPFSIPLELVNRGIALQLNYAGIIAGALGGDPPRQDYKLLDSPHKLELPPVQAGGGLTPARAAALNALDDALAEANAEARASATALDRSGGASAAGDLQWSSLQSAAVIHYNQLLGTALITVAARIDNILIVAAGEGETSLVISASQVISIQQHLKAGFTAQEISDAHTVGLTDADLETIRKKISDEGPEELTGDQVSKLRALRDQLLVLSDALLHPVAFQPSHTISGSPGLPAAPAATNTIVQLSNTTSTFQVANPLTATSPITVDLRTRRIDLPADWSVSVSPAQVINLAPGAVTTATVAIVAGSPLRQGSLPQAAVEGYVGSQLLGGVVFSVVAPNYVFFDGTLRVYLPLTRK